MKFLTFFCETLTICLEFPSKTMQWFLPKLLRHIDFTLSDDELADMPIEYTILAVFCYYTLIAVLLGIICIFKGFPEWWVSQATVLWGWLVILVAAIYSYFFMFSHTD